MTPHNFLNTIFLYTPWFSLYWILYQIVVYAFIYRFTLSDYAPKQHDTFQPGSDGNMLDVVFHDVPLSLVLEI